MQLTHINRPNYANIVCLIENIFTICIQVRRSRLQIDVQAYIPEYKLQINIRHTASCCSARRLRIPQRRGGASPSAFRRWTATARSRGSWSSDCLSESTPDGPTSPPPGTRYARFYSFTLSEQSDVTITLESETDPYIFVLDGDGDVVAENDDIDTSGGNFNSRIETTLDAGGYTIEATTYSRESNCSGYLHVRI